LFNWNSVTLHAGKNSHQLGRCSRDQIGSVNYEIMIKLVESTELADSL